MSAIGQYLWWLLPQVRKRKEPGQSVLFGFLDAVGTVLDELKGAILTSRLRRYISVRNPNTNVPYYDSEECSSDLDLHALDRGLRRLAGESNDQLTERLLTLPYRNQFLGAKIGMKYLIEEIFGLRCDEIVEYYADDQALLVLSEIEQTAEVAMNISHIFNESDQSVYETYRQNRIYRESDLTMSFHFWVSISNPGEIQFEREVVTEAINSQKPAHTRALIYFN
jgi:hypothetical protein